MDTGLTVPRSETVDVHLPDSISFSEEDHYSKEEEDSLVMSMSTQFADWVAAFLRRVILLFENLPEEGTNGNAGGQTEGISRRTAPALSLTRMTVNLVDAVCSAFSQICVHLSEPIYDMVLNMVFEYASTNIRSNAVRAIHQLVECVANANPAKTLAKFLPFCIMNIRAELDHGASSVRTTSLNSTPLPSDSSLHWSKLLTLYLHPTNT
jgi:proteasome activator subunit 4